MDQVPLAPLQALSSYDLGFCFLEKKLEKGKLPVVHLIEFLGLSLNQTICSAW